MKTEAKIQGDKIFVQIDGETVGCTTSGIPSTDQEINATIKANEGEEHTITVKGLSEWDKPVSVNCVVYMKRKNIIYVTNIANGQRCTFDFNTLKSSECPTVKDLPLGSVITLNFP
jgi:hypothetical protein